MQITQNNYKQITVAQLQKMSQQQQQHYYAVAAAARAAAQKAKKPPYYKQQQTTLKQLAASVMRLQHDLRISASTKNAYVENMFNSYLQHVHNDNALLATIENNNCVS